MTCQYCGCEICVCDVVKNVIHYKGRLKGVAFCGTPSSIVSDFWPNVDCPECTRLFLGYKPPVLKEKPASGK